MNKSKGTSNIENLNYDVLKEIYENKEMLNYKQLCNRLEIDELTGNSKLKQLKELSGILKYKRIGQKYLITELCDKENYIPVLEKEFRERNPHFNIEKKYKNECGIYKIELGNEIYIGKSVNLYKRYEQHRYNSSTTGNRLLSNGGVMTLIQLCNNMSDKDVLKLEEFYIKFYSSLKCVKCVNKDFNILNSRRNNFTFEISNNDYEKVTTLLNENNINYVIK